MFFKPWNVRRDLYLVASLLLLSSLAYSAAPATMRLDYYHTGNATAEMFGFDRVVIEPLLGRATSPKPSTTAIWGITSSKCTIRRVAVCCTRAVSAQYSASGRKPRKRRNSIARSPSHYAFPLPRRL